MTKRPISDALTPLHNKKLVAVTFILDYLMLQFDRTGTLNAMVWPVLLTPTGSFHFGDAGYRDQLCALIGRVVRETEVVETERLKLIFDNDVVLTVPIRPEESIGEKALFTTVDHELWAFSGFSTP